MLFPLIKIVTALLLLLIFSTANAVSIEASQTPANALTLQLHYLQDKTGTLSLAEARSRDSEFQPALVPSPSFGFTPSVYWFKTTLSSTRDIDWVLDIEYPLLDKITLYRISGQHISRFDTGDSLPLENRLIKERSFAFPIEYRVANPALEIFIRVQTSSAMQLPIRLWKSDAYYTHDHNEQILLGIFYGILIGAFLYNLLLAFSTKDSVCLLYCFYVGSFTLFQLSINGLAAEYLWPNNELLVQRAIPIFMSLAGCAALLFSRSFLELKKNNPLLNKIYFLALAPLLATAPFIVHADYLTIIKILTVSIIMVGLIILLSSWVALFTHGANARYFILAWSCFLIGVLGYGLKTLGYLPYNLLSEYAIQVGSAMEVTLLSFAIAARFNKLREDNIRIQTEATTTLEHKVEKRTKDLRDAIENLSIANQKLEALNTLDGLTGIYNKSYLEKHLEELWNLAKRSNNDISILMIDIDHFKATNDTHGHLTGDAVITEVATKISQTLKRSTDVVARYGGEEFVVILPATPLEGALFVAEKIRTQVEQTPIYFAEQTLSATISIGAASTRPGAADSQLTLLGNADKALYTAKDQGRNCVCHFHNSTVLAA